MADEIDIANDLNAFFLDAALREQRSKPLEAPKGIGMCLNCEEDIDDDRRWCDDGCRDDYFKAQWQAKQKRANDDE